MALTSRRLRISWATRPFSYKANDGELDSNVVTVTITVDAVNDAPVAVADAYNTDEDTPLTIAAAGVLANDTDVEGATLSAVLVDPVSSGTLVSQLRTAASTSRRPRTS